MTTLNPGDKIFCIKNSYSSNNNALVHKSDQIYEVLSLSFPFVKSLSRKYQRHKVTMVDDEPIATLLFLLSCNKIVYNLFFSNNNIGFVSLFFISKL